MRFWYTLLPLLALTSCLERRQKARPASDDAPLVLPAPSNARAQPPIGDADPHAMITVRLPSAPRHLNPLLGGDTIAVQVALGDIYDTLLDRKSVV